jgi:hypothetical protein
VKEVGIKVERMEAIDVNYQSNLTSPIYDDIYIQIRKYIYIQRGGYGLRRYGLRSRD